MRLLIECTYVYDHPYFNSGIQRVVRNVVQALDDVSSPVECIPVVLKNNCVYKVFQLQPEQDDHLLLALVRLEDMLKRYWYCHAILEKKWPFSASKNLRRVLFVIAKLLWFTLRYPMGKIQERIGHHVDAKRAYKITPHADDVLILLDSSWHSNAFSTVENLKAKGLKVVSVIYDLIPVTHPQFCDDGLVVVFKKWFDWIASTADGFIAISATISSQVEQTVVQRLGANVAQSRWYDFFYLGSDLDLTHETAAIRSQVQNVFAHEACVYLMVSTIEPRKNHAYLLDAFELLWAGGRQVELCFIGKIGWKCNDLIRRIESHPEFGKRLHMLNDLSDTELEYCYEHSKALTFPSYVEGFGLPIVEAMQRGLPVMASNIPVFREVGSDFIAYFDLEDPLSLAQLVISFETTGKFPALRTIGDWQWINWRGATDMLISKILGHVEPQRTASDLPDAVTRANYS